MADRELATILSRIRRAAAEGSGVSDAQLLGRFAVGRDEAAFELLVWRYARLVFGVCRRVLHDLHDAEDALQATFLALARQAGRINRREAVAGWLHKVAYRVALTARAKRARRAAHERPLRVAEDVPAPPEDTTPAESADLRAVLDQEVSRLPDRLRAPVVLCHLEGKTIDEAALLIGCPRGTVASRLARARERLRTRLARRGLVLAAGLAAVSQAGAAPRPVSLISTLVRAAVHSTAAGAAADGAVSLKVVTLTEEVLRAMFFQKLKTVTFVLVAVAGVLLAGGGLAVHLRAGARPEPAEPAARETPNDARRAGADPAAPSKSVVVRHPVRRKVAPYEDYTGRLEALRTVEVRAGVSGRLLKVLFKAGADVKEGDLLFEIDPRTYQLALDKAAANLAVAEAQKKQADANLKRVRKLLDANAIGREEVDKPVADAVAAEAAYKLARVEVERAHLKLASTKVTAPTDGRVGRPRVDPGNQVFNGETATLLTTLTQSDPIGLSFQMDERSYLRYQRLLREHRINGTGSPLSMRLSDEDGFPHVGILDGFDNRVDPDTGTIRVRGIFPNPDRLLLPGMFARVRMPFGKPYAALLIPDEAIQSDQGESYVYVLNKDDKVEYRLVKPGQVFGGLRVIQPAEKGKEGKEGLEQGERVIVGGLKDLHPGDRVKPLREAPGKTK